MNDIEKKDIVEGNTAMYKYLGYYSEGGKLIHPTGSAFIRPETLEALPDWNTLMEAVIKISMHDYGEEDGSGEVDRAFPRTFGMRHEETGMMMVRFNRCPLFEAPTLKEATWKAVVDFCKDEIQKDKK